MKYIAGLMVSIILGLFLRTHFLSKNILTFGYDQARDAYVSLQITKGDLKILGPSASTPGLYHGVFYYYLLAPAYLIGHGSPITAAYWIAFLNSLTIPLVYYFVLLMTKKSINALISAFIMSISFEASQYANWLSNPTIGILTVPLIYLGLWMWLKERKKAGVVLSGIALGLSIQAEIFLGYHIVPVIILLYLGRNNLSRKDIVTFALSLIVSLTTMIAVEFKFGFKSIGGILNLLSAEDAIISSKGFGDLFVLYFNQLGKAFAYTVYPGNVGYGATFVLILGAIALLKKRWNISWQKLLSIWLFSHVIVVSMGGTSSPFLLVGMAPAIAMIVGINIGRWWDGKNKIIAGLLLAIITFGNLRMIFRENIRGQTIFAIQKDMLLKNQLLAIDYTYLSSAGKQFSINSLTSPLWINIVWTYLYKWYGLEKYGYLPQWHGRDQIGQLDSLPHTNLATHDYYLIIEPMDGIPNRYLGETISEEDNLSKLVEEVNFGSLRVQKRIKI